MLIYLDTETTGLYPGQICQLSYIIQNGTKLTPKNFFFSVDYVEKSAQMIHGFSVELLKQLSGGNDFSCDICEIERDFLSANCLIAHNTAFDFSFLRKEFERQNKVFMCKSDFCSGDFTVFHNKK